MSDGAPWLQPYHFKPGQSGNPKGRPKGQTLRESVTRKLLKGVHGREGFTTLDEIAEAWVRKCRDGDIPALKLLADREWPVVLELGDPAEPDSLAAHLAGAIDRVIASRTNGSDPESPDNGAGSTQPLLVSPGKTDPT